MDNLKEARNGQEKYCIITGFEPFGTVDINPSWQAASKLNGKIINGYKIISLELPVVYSDVQVAVPKLHGIGEDFRQKPAFILHMGASGQRPRCYFRFETRAHGVGYHKKRDNLGQTPAGGFLRLPKGSVACGPRKHVVLLPVNNDFGSILVTTLATTPPDGLTGDKHAWSLELSDDAGRYLCEYVFHLSLRCSRIASGWKKEQEVPINFLHVPVVGEEELLDQKDVDAAVYQIVEAMINCL